MIGHLIRHSSFFKTIFEENIERRRGRGRPRGSYVEVPTGKSWCRIVSGEQGDDSSEGQMEDTPPTRALNS